MYLPLIVLCPPLAPLVRLVARAFPDANMRKARPTPNASVHHACMRGLSGSMLVPLMHWQSRPGDTQSLQKASHRALLRPLAPVESQGEASCVLTAPLQLLDARHTLRSCCARLLQSVRDADSDAAAGAEPAKLGSKRYIAPGSFLHHVAHSQHHPSHANGGPLKDSEIMQQARRALNFTFINSLPLLPRPVPAHGQQRICHCRG